MSTEILPSNDGIEQTTSKNWAADKGEEVVITKSGPVDNVELLYNADLVSAETNPTSGLTNISLKMARGRGELNETFLRTVTSSFTGFASEEGLQELLAIDVLRPIYAAPYWTDAALGNLTPSYIAEVRVWIENGNTEANSAWAQLDEQTRLFDHIVSGSTTYYETSYVFRRTFRASNATVKKMTIDDVNTVVTLPTLSKTLQNFIQKIPDGEWLKRPTQFRFLGKEGWEISEEYLWAPKWSVIYGGTLFADPA